jgi:hypothetical protein
MLSMSLGLSCQFRCMSACCRRRIVGRVDDQLVTLASGGDVTMGVVDGMVGWAEMGLLGAGVLYHLTG